MTDKVAGNLAALPEITNPRYLCDSWTVAISALKGEKVRLIGCGRSTTYAATESGKLFSFGANGDCQLGVPSEKGQSALKPVHIAGLKEQQYKMLAGGADHAAALTGKAGVG